MLINEILADFGQSGLFSLSTDQTADVYGPLLAPRFHYAIWIDAEGQGHDRRDLVCYPVSADVVNARFDELGGKYRAGGRVHQEIEWKAQFVQPDCRVYPTAACAVGRGRMVLAYLGFGGGLVLRLVDVPGDRELDSLTIPESEMLAWSEYELGHVYAQLQQGGPDFFVMFSMGAYRLYTCADDRLQFIRDTGGREFALGNNELLAGDRKTSSLRLLSLPALNQLAMLESPYSGWIVYQAGCEKPGRFALGHSGGTVEVVDISTMHHKAYRPAPDLGKQAQPTVSLGCDGRYLLVGCMLDYYLIDTELDLIANLDVPAISLLDGEAVDIPKYHPGMLARDHEFVTVIQGELMRQDYTGLPWRPAVMARMAPRAKVTGTGSQAVVQAASSAPQVLQKLERWRHPQIQLVPSRQEKARSQLYGGVTLPAGLDWPLHDGEPMLLLAYLDLAEVAAAGGIPGLPASGSLLFFAAADQESVLIDDDFLPVAIRVQLLADDMEAGVSHQGCPAFGRLPVTLAKGQHDLPPTDSLAVSASGLSEQEVEDYRAWCEENVPKSSGADFRLGGYAAAIQANTLERDAQGFIESGQRYSLSDALEASLDWQLLMQFDSDEQIMWGTDSGMLYLMIRKQDLEAGDFSRVVALTAGC